ncbi:MAG: hypothetical protein U0235_16030 [Polyangiaceae bacterium]
MPPRIAARATEVPREREDVRQARTERRQRDREAVDAEEEIHAELR